MPTAEPIDYAAKLEQIFSRDSREGNFYIFASQISMIRQAAALIRRQAEEIARLRGSEPPRQERTIAEQIQADEDLFRIRGMG
jgi:hypothetical protein